MNWIADLSRQSHRSVCYLNFSHIPPEFAKLEQSMSCSALIFLDFPPNLLFEEVLSWINYCVLHSIIPEY